MKVMTHIQYKHTLSIQW